MLPKSTRLLFLDTLPVLRLLEFHPDYYPALSALLDAVHEKNVPMVTSPMTLMEMSLQAFRQNQPALARQYQEFFTRSRLLRVRETDAGIAVEAARLQALHALSTSEALQVATAVVSGADLLLCGNARWKEFCDADVLTLDELLS